MTRPGRLVRSRVVHDAGVSLVDALDRRLSGYVILEPRTALLGAASGRGLITFETGVPVLASHSSGACGIRALEAIATPGPYRVELYVLPDGALAEAHGLGSDSSGSNQNANTKLRVPPDAPAQRLACDATLADRTRRVARAGRHGIATDDESTERGLAEGSPSDS